MILIDALLALCVVLLLVALIAGHKTVTNKAAQYLEKQQQVWQGKEYEWWKLNEEGCRDRCLIEALTSPWK